MSSSGRSQEPEGQRESGVFITNAFVLHSSARVKRVPRALGASWASLNGLLAEWRRMFPFVISFGRPSRAELLVLCGCSVLVGSALAWSRASTATSESATGANSHGLVPLQVSSWPSGAAISVDGQPESNTPTTVLV